MMFNCKTLIVLGLICATANVADGRKPNHITYGEKTYTLSNIRSGGTDLYTHGGKFYRHVEVTTDRKWKKVGRGCSDHSSESSGETVYDTHYKMVVADPANEKAHEVYDKFKTELLKNLQAFPNEKSVRVRDPHKANTFKTVRSEGTIQSDLTKDDDIKVLNEKKEDLQRLYRSSGMFGSYLLKKGDVVKIEGDQDGDYLTVRLMTNKAGDQKYALYKGKTSAHARMRFRLKKEDVFAPYYECLSKGGPCIVKDINDDGDVRKTCHHKIRWACRACRCGAMHVTRDTWEAFCDSYSEYIKDADLKNKYDKLLKNTCPKLMAECKRMRSNFVNAFKGFNGISRQIVSSRNRK